MVRPGDGEQFVYSPVNTNATLHCAVNYTHLAWSADGLNFDNDNKRNILFSRGIFQSTNTVGALTQSTLTVYGERELNNNIEICCEYLDGARQRDSCTTLVIYGKFDFILYKHKLNFY